MGWKQKIHDVLDEHGPLRTGDLIAALGFDVECSALDVGTRFMDGLKPLNGSFCDSKAQRRLGKMVERSQVVWQRAANMDNWYRLPSQEFSMEAAPRTRTLRTLMEEILSLMPQVDYYGKAYLDALPDYCEKDEWALFFAEIKPDDVWVEFSPFVLSSRSEGWELADGDPICNWCGHTFTEVYPMDVKASVIVDRMKKFKETEELETA